jgi:hypothetical protein
MPKTALTYRQLDEQLRALGFTAQTLKGEARVYTHKQTGARIFQPDIPLDREVLPRHLADARFVLDDYGLGELNNGQIAPTKP